MKELIKYFCSIFFLIIINNLFGNNNYSKEKIIKIADELADDKFFGRGTGQIGGELAANYLDSIFKEIGLKPIGDNGTFRQNIPFHEITILQDTELYLLNENSKHNLNYFNDFVIYKSGELSFFPKQTEMIFVGFGIIAPEFDYNDYQRIDVSEKVVVIFSGEPNSQDPDYFDAELPTKYSDIELKQKIAMSRGAKACIIIPNPEELKNYGYPYLQKEYSRNQLSLAYYPSAILTIIINPEKAKLIFENSKFSYQELLRNFYKNNLSSFELTSKFSFKGSFKDRNFVASNIIGMIEGSDSKLKETFVIISAHYDHLGINSPINNDSIYNGYMDNAIGASALINIAELIINLKIKTKRSIIFLLTTAEEKGLLGSIFYCNNPVFPLYKTIANINIDGLASIDEFKSIIGIGASFSSLKEILSITASDLNLIVEDLPKNISENNYFNRSDQIAFAKAGIPSILITDGTDYKNIDKIDGLEKLYDYFSNIYHSPIDDNKQLINYDATVQHFEFIYKFIINIANSITEPEWNKDSSFLLERLKTRAEKR